METFTLIVWLYTSGLTREVTRTPDLTQAECERRAAAVQAPRRAMCEHALKRFERQCADCGVVPRDKGPNRPA